MESTSSASDADGGELSYLLSYSWDGGASWVPLNGEMGEEQLSYRFDLSNIPGGDDCRVRLIATDGWNRVEVVSEQFVVPTKVPSAQIFKPEDGSVFYVGPWGDEVVFNGFVFDAEDGFLSSDALVWSSTIDGQLGVEEAFALTEMSEGEHVIRLSGTDSDGQTAEATVSVTILAGYVDEDQDGLPDNWELKFLDTLDSGAEDDPDRDGYTNLDEFRGFGHPGGMSTTALRGDLNQDGEVSEDDVELCLRMSKGLGFTVYETYYVSPYPPWLVWRADMDNNGSIDIQDGIRILRMTQGLDPM